MKALRATWELFRRRPLLLSPFVLIGVWIAAPGRLRVWIDEASGS